MEKADFNPDYYNGHYFERDKYGGKKYHNYNGTVKEWGYYAKQHWMGWNSVIESLKKILDFHSVLDVACGPGSFVSWARIKDLDVYGLDFSRFAIRECLPQARGLLLLADGLHIPFKDESFDFVIASDYMEHIFISDIDQALNEIFRVAKKWVFLQICTRLESEQDIILRKGQKVPMKYEGTAVSGHVTIKNRVYWLKKVARENWVLRENLVKRFRELTPPEVIKAWRNIIIMERQK